MGYLAGIGMIALLIIIHELGHFAAARLQGIYANRFSIGFGPVLWKVDTPDTEFALRLLPFGGYVGFPDDDPESIIPKNDPNLLKNRPILDRAIVMIAGVMANAVFTYLSLLLLVLLTGIEVPQAGVRIPSVNNPQGPAARAGILPGDIILQAGGQDLGDTHSMDRFRQLIEASPQKPIPLIILREGSQITKVVTPSAQGKIEVGLSPNILIRAPQNPLEPLSAAGVRFWDLAGTTVSNFGQLFTGKVGVDQLSSPVGIVKMAADVSATNPLSLLYMTALISFSLAFLNILPIPGLDGSHLAFLLIEAIRGKPVSEAIQNRLLQTGLVFLMGLSAMLIFKDSFNWLLKGSPF